MDNVSITDATITTVQECETLEAAPSQTGDVRCEEDAATTEIAASEVAVERVTETDAQTEVKDSKEFTSPSYIIDTTLPIPEDIKCPDINLSNYQAVIEEDPRVAYTDYDLLATNLQRVCQTPDLAYNLPLATPADYSTVLQDQERDDIVPSYAPEYLKLEALKCVAQPGLYQGTDETVFHDSLPCVDGSEASVTITELSPQEYYMEKIDEDVHKEAISELEEAGRPVSMDQQEDGAMALPLESDAVVMDGENATIGIREFENGPIMQFPVSEILDHKVVTEGISFSHQVAEVTDSRVQEMEDYESGMEEEEEDDTILTQTAAAMEEVSLREPDTVAGAAAASAAVPGAATAAAAASSTATTSSVVAPVVETGGKKGKGRKSRRDKFFTKLLLGLAYKFDSKSHSSRKNISRSVEESSCATALTSGAAAVPSPTDKKGKSGTLPRAKMRGKSLVGRLFGSGRSEQPPITPGSPAIHRLHSTVSRHALPTMPSTTMNKDSADSRPPVPGQQSPVKREEATSRKFRLLTGLKFGSTAGPPTENVKKNNINWFEMLDSGMRPAQQRSGAQIDKPPGVENVANAANT